MLKIRSFVLLNLGKLLPLVPGSNANNTSTEIPNITKKLALVLALSVLESIQ